MAQERLTITYNGSLVGELVHDTSSDRLSIRYDEQWKREGFAISPHIPLKGRTSPYAVDLYLKNLLPEGEGLETLSVYTQVSKANTFGLLHSIGLDVSGALMFGESSLTDEPLFKEVTQTRLRERIDDEGLDNIAIWDGKVRLSVAGVQAKLAVYVKDGRIGFGDGSLASTHILKFEKRPGSHLVINEVYCMRLAKMAGMDAAKVELKRLGVHNAILVERFDRTKVNDERVVRKHVLDGCQLLNIAPGHKYERSYGSADAVRHVRGGVSLKKLFDAIDTKTFKSAAQTKLFLLKWAIYTLLIGNADAHGKNISFLVDKKGIVPAPLYDMLSVAMHTDLDTAPGAKVDQELAMAFGDEFEVEAVKGQALIEFAEAIDLPVRLVANTATDMCKRVENALGDVPMESLSADELQFVATLEELIARRISVVRDAARYMLGG